MKRYMNDAELDAHCRPDPHVSCPACHEDCTGWVGFGKPCQKTVEMSINDMITEAHQNAINKGWYEEPKSFVESIALMHSELSEALEEYRNGSTTRSTYYDGFKPCGIPIELADVVIRIFDTCGYLGIDLEKAIEIKMTYNATRPHRHGGKML